MEDIRWLDGKSAAGKYILKIEYSGGSTGYLKNESPKQIDDWYKLLQDCPDVAQLTIYNPDASIAILRVCFEGHFKKAS